MKNYMYFLTLRARVQIQYIDNAIFGLFATLARIFFQIQKAAYGFNLGCVSRHW